MSNEKIRELLLPHAKRPIRAFWRAPDPGNHQDTTAFDAFMDLVYGPGAEIPHQVAQAVERELADCSRPVGDVLAGWRPEALKEICQAAADRGESDPWENRGGAL